MLIDTPTHPPIGFKQGFYIDLPDCYVDADAAQFDSPELVYFNHDYAASLKLSLPTDDTQLAALFSGQALPSDAKPIAQAYAGHQFGHFNPSLGDGRAMILGEIEGTNGELTELDLKGSGPTPFSRNGDGKAAIGPMLREVLISEAIHAMHIPTTRSLAVVNTGERVFRSPPQSGAVLARTADSHIRIGTFQYFAARDQHDVIGKLVTYCIDRHYGHLQSSEQPAVDLLNAVVEAQADLVAQWMGVGFIHGVMNTDNILIGAQTIDYGPCAFMDTYDPTTVFSSIDANSRYAYMNQPPVMQWNLARLAETLLAQLSSNKDEAIELATNAVKRFNTLYNQAYLHVMCAKLGMQYNVDSIEETQAIESIVSQWTDLLTEHNIDWSRAHIALTCHLTKQHDRLSLLGLFNQSQDLTHWLALRDKFSQPDLSSMKEVNPIVLPRNHLVEEAIDAASLYNDYAPFFALLTVLQQPYNWPTDDKYTQASTAAFTEEFVTYCGT